MFCFTKRTLSSPPPLGRCTLLARSSRRILGKETQRRLPESVFVKCQWKCETARQLLQVCLGTCTKTSVCMQVVTTFTDCTEVQFERILFTVSECYLASEQNLLWVDKMWHIGTDWSDNNNSSISKNNPLYYVTIQQSRKEFVCITHTFVV